MITQFHKGDEASNTIERVVIRRRVMAFHRSRPVDLPSRRSAPGAEASWWRKPAWARVERAVSGRQGRTEGLCSHGREGLDVPGVNIKSPLSFSEGGYLLHASKKAGRGGVLPFQAQALFL